MRGFLIAAVIALCSCSKGPQGLSADTCEAVRKAVPALRRANEYRDSGTLLFEPRLLEAEREANGIMSAQKNASDASAAGIAKSCIEDLRLYRESQTLHLDYLNRPPLPHVKDKATNDYNVHKKALEDYEEQEMVNNARQNLDSCIAALAKYL